MQCLDDSLPGGSGTLTHYSVYSTQFYYQWNQYSGTSQVLRLRIMISFVKNVGAQHRHVRERDFQENITPTRTTGRSPEYSSTPLQRKVRSAQDTTKSENDPWSHPVTMADLNNLLAELDGAQDENILLQPPVESEEEIDRDYEGVPEVLKAAQERKHQDDDQDIDGVGQFDEDLGTTLNMAQDEDYARLKTAWIKELLCPELLPYDHDTISLEQELIEGQEETIDALTSTKNVDALVAHIYRLDVERTKFIMSDLLVTRLDKLEAHALHNRTVLDRMSDREVSFLCPIVLVSTWESLILCSCGIFPLSFSLVAHFRFRI